MFTGRLAERPKHKTITNDNQDFVLKGHQLQTKSESCLTSSSYSFCSCKCKCHQCSGNLAESLSSQLKDLQKKYCDVVSSIQSTKPRKDEEANIFDLRQQFSVLQKEFENQSDMVKLHQNCAPSIEDLKGQVRKLSSKVISLENLAEEKNVSNDQVLTALKHEHTMDLEKQGEYFELRLNELQLKHRSELNDLTSSHEQELAAKDATISRMRANVVLSFDQNARERQQQIDELVKEIQRTSTDAAIAQASLVNLRLAKTEKQDSCAQCTILQKEVHLLSQKIKGKDTVIEDLNAICSEMRNQLLFQGEIGDLLRKSKELSS